MRRSLPAIMALTSLALAAGGCARNKIINVDNGNNLKSEPQESKQDEKRDAAQIHTQLGAQLMERGELKDADEKFKMAIQFDDSYEPAHTMLAILDERIKQPQLAEQQYRRALAIDPKNGDTNNNLGYFLCHHGRGNEGMQYLQRALSDPFYKTPATADTNAGACLISMGNNAAAEPYLQKALHADPDYPDGLYQMAQLLYAKNDAFRARAFLQRFEAQGTATPDALLLGYRIESRLGDADAARNYANRLRDQFPDSEQTQKLGANPP
ncbi:MAG: type IV pilus biogenesis/stability protein PilW [Rhodanobacteraceae bacterium]|nr:type IV pilus biogenesis/stability protein PilW [Pseudomonadota bacterium]